MARATPWERRSIAPVHPTQNSTSASGCSASVLTSRPFAQSVRSYTAPRHGWPRCSMLMSAAMPVSGISAFSMTRCRRMSTIELTCSTPTGHSCTHAPHVRQSHRASSPIQPPIRGLPPSGPPLAAPAPTSRTCSFRFSTTCMGRESSRSDGRGNCRCSGRKRRRRTRRAAPCG